MVRAANWQRGSLKKKKNGMRGMGREKQEKKGGKKQGQYTQRNTK